MKDSKFEKGVFDDIDDINDTVECSEDTTTNLSEGKDDSSHSDEELAHRKLFELLSQAKSPMAISDDDFDSDDEDEYDDMDADDIHNKAVSRARMGKYREAAGICINGLKKYPFNVDLLADTINYSSEAGDIITAAKQYSGLKERIPLQRWNWRAFTFSIDYLLKEDPITNEAECRTIINNYKAVLPHEEKASMAESKLEEALGNIEASMRVLVEAVNTLTNASQCALRLADMQMERGLYSEVLATANYGIAASAEAQPSINVPYLYYLRTLAKDHLLHKKECTGESITKEELDVLVDEYELLDSEFPELLPYSRTIQTRAKMLKFIRAE